jgi:hypothetical protein
MTDYSKAFQKLKEDLFRTSTGYPSARAWMDAEKKEALDEAWSGPDSIHLGSGYALTKEEREKYHWHIIGATGSGKSRLMQHLIQRNIGRGQGGMLIDPVRHLFDRTLTFCARNKIPKVAVIDPGRFEYLNLNAQAMTDRTLAPRYLSFNPLVPLENETAQACARRAADAIITSWGGELKSAITYQYYLPMMLEVLIRTKATIIELEHFLHQDSEIANALMNLAGDCPAVRELRELYEAKWQRFHAEMQSSQHRLNFVQVDNMRYVLGQGSNAIDLAEMMNDGWFILVNLSPKGWAGGGDFPRIVGSLLLNVVLEVEPSQHFYVYIDEVADFATDYLKQILRKKRQEKVVLHLAHQDLSQLDSDLEGAIFGNCRAKAVFNLLDDTDRERFARTIVHDRSQAKMFQSPDQTAVISIPEREPEKIQIKGVYDEAGNVDEYLFRLYSERDSQYLPADEALARIARRQARILELNPASDVPADTMTADALKIWILGAYQDFTQNISKVIRKEDSKFQAEDEKQLIDKYAEVIALEGQDRARLQAFRLYRHSISHPKNYDPEKCLRTFVGIPDLNTTQARTRVKEAVDYIVALSGSSPDSVPPTPTNVHAFKFKNKE